MILKTPSSGSRSNTPRLGIGIGISGGGGFGEGDGLDGFLGAVFFVVQWLVMDFFFCLAIGSAL